MIFLKKIFSYLKLICGYQLGFSKVGSKEIYLKVFNTARSKHYYEIDKFEKTMGFAVNKKWLDDLALSTQVTIKKSDINYQHGRVLYSALSKYLIDNTKIQNINIFESGTARGFSSICMSKALVDNNHNGVIHTVDILPHRLKIYWNIISDHTIGKITRKELIQKWSDELKFIKFYEMKTSLFCRKYDLKRINFAFLDAVHDSKNIDLEFNYVQERQIKGDMIIFDDFDDQYNDLKEYILKKVPSSYNYQILESEKNRHYFIAQKK